jgi:3-deoxy-D-manno-octulosonic acid kinase
MTSPAPEIPPGFIVRKKDGISLVLREDIADALEAAGVARPEEAAVTAGDATRRFEGRGKPASFPVPGTGLRVVARRYLHGGLLSGITGGLFPGAGRFLRELRLLQDLTADGVPVPEPLGLVVQDAPAGTARGWMLTREIEGVEDLRALILRTEPGSVERGAALVSCGRAVRRLHDAGVLHNDLHVKNLLVPLDGGPATVVDLDGGKRLAGGLRREQRVTQLQRLDRSLEKLSLKSGARLARTDRWRLVHAYMGKDRPSREERDRWVRRHRAHLARHRMGWALTGLGGDASAKA